MRLRITFSKSGALRYSGHLDLHSLWERTVRRAGLALYYTQGFHPGPKIQLASALPLGFIGRAEIVDLWINETGDTSISNESYQERLQHAASPGMVITFLEVVAEHSPALQTQVISAEYEVTFLDPVDGPGLESNISGLLGTASLTRERRGKTYDLRPLIESLVLLPGEGSEVPRLYMRLSTRQGATGRPEEVLGALGIPFETTRIERIRLILQDKAETVEPG